MNNKAEPKSVPTELVKLGVNIEADYLEALTDEELDAELDSDVAALSALELKRLEKADGRLQRNVAALLNEERKALDDIRGTGLRAAAHEGNEPAQSLEQQYVPLSRAIEISGKRYDLGIAAVRPREIVVVGELPVGATALRIGNARFELLPTPVARVTRCSGLGEPQLKTLLEADPAPSIEIIVRDE